MASFIAFVAALASSGSAASTEAAVSEEQRYPPGIELPAGEGRELLLRACTRCHDLKGLVAYQGYWNETRWQRMVETMVNNGARLTAEEQGRVSAYLARHFGPGTRPAR